MLTLGSMYMSLLRIRPWPFKKDEDVELYWMGSVLQSPTKQWFLNCVFKKENGEFSEIELPWATLPGLIIGRKYKNGICNIDLPEQEAIQVDIPADTKFEICSCSEIPKGLYSFKDLKSHKQEFLCRFRVGAYNYFIPCTEVVRSILAPYQVFANQILKLNGLEDLFEKEYENGDVYEIDLSREYPKKLLKSHIVGYFVWLSKNEKAYYEWNSVYRNLLLSASEIAPVFPALAFTWGVSIKALPPVTVDCTWRFYGKKYKENYFVQELIYQDGVDLKYKVIKYTHPTQQKLNKVNKPRNERIINKGRSKKNAKTVLDKNKLPSSRTKTVTSVEQPTVRFRFNEFIICEKMKKGAYNVNIGGDKKTVSEFSNTNFSSINISTTQDWALDGKLNSIEFNTLELVKDNPEKGLERFLKVIFYIKKYFDKLDFEISVTYLPSNKIFSKNDNGSRRTCAFVKVYKEKVLQFYIIEFSRSDEWSISTLYIWPLSPSFVDRDFETVAVRLLNCAVNNDGHWDNEVLSGEPDFRFEMTKHVLGQSVERWAEILVEKVLKS